MKKTISFLIIFLLALTIQVPAQTAAKKTKTYAVKSNTHASKAHTRAHAHVRHRARR